MNTKLSKAFLIFTISVLIGTIVWLLYPSPYRVCHFILTGMGRGRLYPHIAKFKPYKGKTMGGVALMATVVKEQIASYTVKEEPYCFLSLGAELSGTAEAFLTRGEAIAKALSAMKLDAMLVGNIDFTFGKESLEELSKTNSFKLLTSNIKDINGKTPEYFSDEIILESDHDLKIGLLGMSPENTPEIVTKASIEGLEFLAPEKILKKRVDSLREKGADLVALLTQYNKEYITAREWLAIASAAPDICFMLDADIEAPVPFAKDGVIIYTLSCYNQTKEIDILNLEITRKRPIEIVGASSNRIGTNLAEYEKDLELESVVDKATADIRADRDRFVGNFASDYARAYYTECPIGDMVAEAMLEESQADIALQNSGSIQNNVNEGKFTIGDLYTLMPFDNKMVVMSLKGSDILELLKISASRHRGILQVAGLEYSYVYINKNNYELKSATIKGEPISKDRLYKVVTSNFLAEGGDGYTPFKRGEEVSICRSQREVVRDYIASASLKAPMVLKTDGRVKVEE